MKLFLTLLFCITCSVAFGQYPRPIPPARTIEKPFARIEINEFRYGYGYPGYGLYIDSYGYQFHGYHSAYGNTHRYQYRNYRR